MSFSGITLQCRPGWAWGPPEGAPETWTWHPVSIRTRTGTGYLLCADCGDETIEGGDGAGEVFTHPDLDETEPGNPLGTRGGYTLTFITCACGNRMVLATGNHKGAFKVELFSVTAAPEPKPAFQSPMEEKFWLACRYAWSRDKFRALKVNQAAGVPGHAYRLDFAVVGKLAAIEIDGFATHSSTADIENDRRRQRDLEAAGWRVTRFGGREVHHAPERCAREALKLIEALPGTWS